MCYNSDYQLVTHEPLKVFLYGPVWPRFKPGFGIFALAVLTQVHPMIWNIKIRSGCLAQFNVSYCCSLICSLTGGLTSQG